MKVFWWQGGLHFEAETARDHETLSHLHALALSSGAYSPPVSPRVAQQGGQQRAAAPRPLRQQPADPLSVNFGQSADLANAAGLGVAGAVLGVPAGTGFPSISVMEVRHLLTDALVARGYRCDTGGGLGGADIWAKRGEEPEVYIHLQEHAK